MDFLKKVGGWAVALFLWLWAVLPKALDWVGRTTLPDDWEQLMAERLPAWAAWLFSTPWWVPALLAATLTFWMIWISRPRSQTATAGEAPPMPAKRYPDDYFERRIFEAWDGVDPLTMTQAAYLWAGEEPGEARHLSGAARARYITLTQGVRDGGIEMRNPTMKQALNIQQGKFGLLDDLPITRKGLEKFIIKSDLRPAPFVFKEDRD